MSSTDNSAQIAIIGGGVVGAACAERLSRNHDNTLVLEAFDRCAEGVTSRNSGVIHSGLYYPPDSLKAHLCIRGLEMLYEWCQKHGVPHAQTGKIIVANGPLEDAALVDLHVNALRSGAEGLTRWSQAKLNSVLPTIPGTAALFAERTGIIDATALTHSLLTAAESRGTQVLTRCAVTAITAARGGYELETSRGPIFARVVINAAGLASDEVARMAGIDRYRIYPCRGDYFRLKGAHFPHLIYPVKTKGSPGLGVHVTLGLDGTVRLGPDAEYVDQKDDFSPRPEKAAAFQKAAEKLLGPIALENLEYDQCGVRPKLRGPMDPQEWDFVICADRPGLINLVGIESPGLTASLAIAELVEKIL